MRSTVVLLFASFFPCCTYGPSSVAAPVPPAPNPDDAALVGTWHQEWGGLISGETTIRADGTYRFVPANPDHATCYGRWALNTRDMEFSLAEWCEHTDGNGNVTRSGPYKHVYPVTEWTGKRLVSVTHETTLDGVLCRSLFVLTNRRP
jgi:hypothetical protein